MHSRIVVAVSDQHLKDAPFDCFLIKAIQTGVLKCNLKGVALGDSWISPVGEQQLTKTERDLKVKPCHPITNLSCMDEYLRDWCTVIGLCTLVFCELWGRVPWTLH